MKCSTDVKIYFFQFSNSQKTYDIRKLNIFSNKRLFLNVITRKQKRNAKKKIFQIYIFPPIFITIRPIIKKFFLGVRFPQLLIIPEFKQNRYFLELAGQRLLSERLFSIGGNIYTTRRNRLTPEHGEILMFLNFNLRAFNFQY